MPALAYAFLLGGLLVMWTAATSEMADLPLIFILLGLANFALGTRMFLVVEMRAKARHIVEERTRS